jgi:glycosyltransferase involved in cell wall biosynthesis
MKKVFLGFYNWGTQAGLHSQMLRKQGFDTKSLVFSDKYNRIADKTISIPSGRIAHVVLRFIYGIWFFFLNFKKDVFIFYGGKTFLPKGLDLVLLKLLGKTIIFYYMGNDVQGYEVSIKKYKYTNMRNYFTSHKKGLRYDKRVSKRLSIHSKYASHQLVCAPCYLEFVPGSNLLPLVINIDDYEFSESKKDSPITILHAPTNRSFKGTRYVETAVKRLIDEGHPVKLVIAEGLSHSDLKEAYKNCDIFVDQLLGGWYGTAAIEAMASGKPVVCFLRESHREYVDYYDAVPIFNADPETIYSALKHLISSPNKLMEMAVASRAFVKEFHSESYVMPRLKKYLSG